MEKIKKIPFQNFFWISLFNPKLHELEQFTRSIHLHPLDLQDCLERSQRTKIELRENYSLLVIHFPLYNRKTMEIQSGEIVFLITDNLLITIHHREFPQMKDLLFHFEKNASLRESFSDKSPERLLYEILNTFYLSIFPMIDHLIIDCDDIEQNIFSNQEKQLISYILSIRRNITDCRKIMQVHKNVLKKLIAELKNNPRYMMKKTDIYFESLVDYTKEIWDTLENLKERIEALQQTNETQISFKLSNIMKILTIISVITFPITLIAAIFGMNTVQSMPFINHPYGFWMVIALMVGIIVFMLVVFKKKGWF